MASMTQSQFESGKTNPFGMPGEGSFFYDNRDFEEVRATLSRGVKARKGLILFTGDAGRGKTVLLHRMIHELENDVTFIVESDPEASFSDFLGLVLLGEADSADRVSRLQSCKRALRAALDRGETVCLILDNAERLRDDTLQSVMQDFLGPGISAGGDQQLLQVILAGRPEITERLLPARLRSLVPVPGIVCQLESLNAQDTADYIKQRIQAGHQPNRTIHRDAIDRIAAYAAGDLRRTNSLCSSVMALADKTSQAQISGELVDAAAHELGWAPLLRDKRPSGSIYLEMPQERDEPFTFQSGDGDTNEVLGQTFLNYHHTEPRHWLRGQRDRSAVRIFLLLIFLGAAFLWLRDQFDGLTLTPWNDRSTSSSGSSQLPAPVSKSNSEPPL